MKLLLILMGMFLAACTHQTAGIKTPAFDEQLTQPKASYANGSIWQASSGGFAEDIKARRKGDTLTILITETASASKEASTGTSRGSSISAGIPNMLGLETNMTGISKWMDLANLINASASSKFDGAGSTTRKENLSATITAKVIELLPNGNLEIEGRRNVKVNNEDQVILVEGTVRPRDISADNVINSSYIADARITYGGKGIISDRQSPGWLMNFIDKVWPF
ncbi:flagellar basal body L-ring protein FlgH [Geobacter pelophilus]|uniref:Flagellar L-ring protein n=1 Tax=Geoanaerobacter pelophilus TaxID=60036 RepID=A0AAW4L1B0_9BACT|nr:flagellar basal body L-ring protein FlgH [Geoanaerobacter pelophilus]MBT0663947.1 flagellar basal body L-ring protein FlgH [Geoanaerobacter pelophilus]